MTVYEVTGTLAFRGHQPGERFEATLDEAVEKRAVRRRSVAVLERTRPRLQDGSYRLPRARVTRASIHEGGR